MEPTPEALPEELRVDGLWWRKFATLGSVYGPEWWKRYSPPVIAAIIFGIIGPNRRGAMANMGHILGTREASVTAPAALRMFVEFAHCMTETMEFFGPRPHPIRVDVPEPDLLATTLEKGRGAVVVTGHLGNWDVAAADLRKYGRHVIVVMAHESNPSTHEYVRRMREAHDIRVVYSDDSVFSSLHLVRALRANHIVAMQLDRTNPHGRLIEVPFFGAPARFSAGPFHLARVAGAPILPSFAPRIGVRHYEIRFGGAHEVQDRSRRGRIEAVAARVVADFEAIVREYPCQWFQFADFWAAPAADSFTRGPSQSVPESEPQARPAARS
ncbi:MAG: lysophospholipid acyltransferase family protein [Candidatus Binatia bacterium]